LEQVADRHGWVLVPRMRVNHTQARGGLATWSGRPADYLDAGMLDLVHQRERLLYGLHFGDEDHTAVWWPEETA